MGTVHSREIPHKIDAYSVADKNGDGVITESDLNEYYKRASRETRDRGLAMFRERAGGDGVMTREEWHGKRKFRCCPR